MGKYFIDTPPPTVSGKLHMGHIFSYCHTDFIARFRRMIGDNVFYPMGFDNNGLPTEKLVEQRTGIFASSENRDLFLSKCHNISEKSVAEFRDLFEKISLSANLDSPYQTISEDSKKMAQMSFLDLWNKNFVYQKDAPVYWDVAFQTALSQADIEDKEVESNAYNINFFLTKGKDSKDITGECVEIMTTRPEMLSACQALFYNPKDERYNGKKEGLELNSEGDKMYINRVDGEKVFIKGLNLANKYCTIPAFSAKILPLIPDEDVKMDKGTGLVMCCTYGDWQDVEWVRKHNLSCDIIISDNGLLKKYPDHDIKKHRLYSIDKLKTILSDEAEDVDISEEEKLVLKKIRKHGISKMITAESYITHQVKCSERSGRPVEILRKEQWYIDLGFRNSEVGFDSNLLKQELLHTSNQIVFHPESMRIKLDQWIKGLNQDWCISRNRFLGIEIPVPIEFIHTKSNKEYVFLTTRDKNNKPEILLEDLFYQGLKKEDIKDLMVKDKKKVEKILSFHPQVFDTWFTSSLTPQLNTKVLNGNTKLQKALLLNEKNKDLIQSQMHDSAPFSLRPQAHEIIRTWTFSTMAKSYLHSLERVSDGNYNQDKDHLTNDRRFFFPHYVAKNDNIYKDIIPWTDIMLSGWCLSVDGEKMSKSKGNTIEPLPLLKNNSSDSIRYWASSSHLGMDTRFNKESLKDANRLVKKIQNIAKFYKMHADKVEYSFSDIANDIKNITAETDKWFFGKLSQSIAKCRKQLEGYEYCHARKIIEQFFWSIMCDDYAEISKARLYGIEGNAYRETNLSIEEGEMAKAKLSAIVTLHYAVNSIIKIFSIYMPSAMNELYDQYFNDKNVFFQDQWPKIENGFNVIDFDKNIDILHKIRKQKSYDQVSIKSPVKEVICNYWPKDNITRFDIESVTGTINSKIVIQPEEKLMKIIYKEQ